MKRILVIGCSGAGKSVFSRKLAAKTGLPLIHLDLYYHDKRFDYYHNKQAWRAKVLDLVKGENWIIDGNYSSTFPERFKMADTIIFFDFPLHSRLYGIFKRRWEFRKTRREDMPEDWEETINWEHFMLVINFHRLYRHKIIDILDKESNKKVITFKNRKQANQYLNR